MKINRIISDLIRTRERWLKELQNLLQKEVDLEVQIAMYNSFTPYQTPQVKRNKELVQFVLERTKISRKKYTERLKKIDSVIKVYRKKHRYRKITSKFLKLFGVRSI